jgi:hypothetical protein
VSLLGSEYFLYATFNPILAPTRRLLKDQLVLPLRDFWITLETGLNCQRFAVKQLLLVAANIPICSLCMVQMRLTISETQLLFRIASGEMRNCFGTVLDVNGE